MSKAKAVVIVLIAMMAALIVHGLFGDAGGADAHLFLETGVPVTRSRQRPSASIHCRTVSTPRWMPCRSASFSQASVGPKSA